MPTGHYQRKPRVARVTIKCEVCRAERQMLPCQARQRSSRFCSQKCAGAARDVRVAIECAQCGVSAMRRRDQILARNFCSSSCVGRHKRETPSVWGENFDPAARRAYFRDYLLNNRGRVNRLSRNWAKKNRSARNRLQQMRRAGGSITQAQWGAILLRHGGGCAQCGSDKEIHMDHIIPVARGGKTEPANLQPLCRPCNQSKGAKLLRATHGIEILET